MPVHNKHQFPQHIWIHTDKSIGVAKESRTHTLSNTGCLNIERHHWIIPCDRQWIQLNVFFFLSLSSYQSRCHTYAHKYMHTLSHLKWCPRESMSYLDTNRSSCPWGMLECNPKLTRVHGTHTHTHVHSHCKSHTGSLTIFTSRPWGFGNNVLPVWSWSQSGVHKSPVLFWCLWRREDNSYLTHRTMQVTHTHMD